MSENAQIIVCIVENWNTLTIIIHVIKTFYILLQKWLHL